MTKNKSFLSAYGEGGIAHLKVTDDKNIIDDNLNSSDSDLREVISKNLNLTTEHLSKLADDKSHYVRRNAATHRNTRGEVLDKFLNDSNAYVRMYAASNSNATKNQIDHAMRDDDPHVRKFATGNPNATKEHVDRALNDKHWEVRYNAISSPHTSELYLRNLSNHDPEQRVRSLATDTLESRAYDDSFARRA